MTSIFYEEPELVIALDKKIVFVNPNDLQIFKEIILPEDLTKCGLTLESGNQDEAQNEEKSTDNKNKEQPTIQHVKMSPNRQLLAVTTAGQKAVLLYQLVKLVHAKLLSVRSLARASSALTFSHDSKRLLVTDKTGDCHEYNCVDYESAPKILLGHLSIVYDILCTKDEKFIITCDRDDKIRVSNYPETADIHSYCLGHKEFVAAIELLNEDTLISASGDKTLKLWNFKEGKELASIDLPAPAIKMAIKSLADNKYEVSILLYEPNESVISFELSQNEDGVWQVDSKKLLTFPDIICCGLAYAKERLYVVGVINDRLTVKLSPDSKEAPENWLAMLEEQFKEIIWTPEDISSWFKKRYDNVSEYLERKKRRIEEKQK